ncbi:MAG TPA: antibiotic biosynthesis monooxygenase [Nitrososphaeraceae archaeon]|nr:antibiotic biosynthesis monooxygenase [Nitrososphaeraceae archaeon]
MPEPLVYKTNLNHTFYTWIRIFNTTVYEFKYIKHNKAKFKAGKRDEGTKILTDFFDEYRHEIKGFRGFLIMHSLNDSQETIALTFWETKEDMDAYHRLDNKWFQIITERIKPLFERIPERSNYTLFDFKT